MTFIYRFESETPPVTPLRLKIEVNTREHFAVLGFVKRQIAINNPWFEGKAEVVTYELEELLATKLRAFYQRKRGRDLFDLAMALARRPELSPDKAIRCFLRYMETGRSHVSRAEFEANLAEKLADRVFRADVGPLLALNAGAWIDFSVVRAEESVHRSFISLLSGEPWRGLSKRGG